MKIISIPHTTLRTVAQPVKHVDKKLRHFVVELQDTLAKKNNPKGVGLAAPQVDVKWRIFTTQLPIRGDQEDDESANSTTMLRIFINPRIVDQSSMLTFGPDKKHPLLEGCLSIPGFYGPVPRYKWVALEYDVIEGDELVSKTERFDNFAARVVQHEYDHLNGVLFIDHILDHELPLYQEDPKTEKLKEMDPAMVAALVQSSQ